MAAKARLHFTENFNANLKTVELFLKPEGRSAFQRLLDRIFDDICHGDDLREFTVDDYVLLYLVRARRI
jgi:hypothetical protein